MSTSISEHARQVEISEMAKEAARSAFTQHFEWGGETVEVREFTLPSLELVIQHAINSATAAKEREFLQYCAQLERDKLDILAQWKQQDDALQARVRELKEALAWTLDHLDEDVEKIHHRKVTVCRQTLQP